jgi:hypothetical protein
MPKTTLIFQNKTTTTKERIYYREGGSWQMHMILNIYRLLKLLQMGKY